MTGVTMAEAGPQAGMPDGAVGDTWWWTEVPLDVCAKSEGLTEEDRTVWVDFRCEDFAGNATTTTAAIEWKLTVVGQGDNLVQQGEKMVIAGPQDTCEIGGEQVQNVYVQVWSAHDNELIVYELYDAAHPDEANAVYTFQDEGPDQVFQAGFACQDVKTGEPIPDPHTTTSIHVIKKLKVRWLYAWPDSDYPRDVASWQEEGIPIENNTWVAPDVLGAYALVNYPVEASADMRYDVRHGKQIAPDYWVVPLTAYGPNPDDAYLLFTIKRNPEPGRGGEGLGEAAEAVAAGGAPTITVGRQAEGTQRIYVGVTLDPDKNASGGHWQFDGEWRLKKGNWKFNEQFGMPWESITCTMNAPAQAVAVRVQRKPIYRHDERKQKDDFWQWNPKDQKSLWDFGKLVSGFHLAPGVYVLEVGAKADPKDGKEEPKWGSLDLVVYRADVVPLNTWIDRIETAEWPPGVGGKGEIQQYWREIFGVLDLTGLGEHALDSLGTLDAFELPKGGESGAAVFNKDKTRNLALNRDWYTAAHGHVDIRRRFYWGGLVVHECFHLHAGLMDVPDRNDTRLKGFLVKYVCATGWSPNIVLHLRKMAVDNTNAVDKVPKGAVWSKGHNSKWPIVYARLHIYAYTAEQMINVIQLEAGQWHKTLFDEFLGATGTGEEDEIVTRWEKGIEAARMPASGFLRGAEIRSEFPYPASGDSALALTDAEFERLKKLGLVSGLTVERYDKYGSREETEE